MKAARTPPAVRFLPLLLASGMTACCCVGMLFAQTRGQLDAARKKMVDEIIVGGGIKNPRVISAMLDTPRHEFLDAGLRRSAYFDMALPIGAQQTISSPFIVAFMTESLDPQPADKVLEIGTGSGYQAAVLSPLVKAVYTIEIVPALGERAQRTLKRLRYDNVFVRIGDGFQGWPSEAPFDKIIVTCSPEKVPQPLVEQLREGGLMVIPVGERYRQTLYLMRKQGGQLKAEALRPTLFVPMTGVAEDRRQVQPDPRHPRVINGRFEEPLAENGFVPGWYYQRQLTWESDEEAPEGEHFVTFHNDDPGRTAHLMQGFPIDGQQVGSLTLSARVRYSNVQAGRHPDELPMVAISLFDENRREIGTQWLGPFRGSSLDWHQVRSVLRIPPRTREGILRIGLFGATGEVSFDDVSMSPRER